VVAQTRSGFALRDNKYEVPEKAAHSWYLPG
jgi:hypothetical protein